MILDVTGEELDALADADLPNLVELELWARHALHIPTLRDWFPNLAHLTLGGFERHGMFAALAPIAPGLTSLALPSCGLDDHGIAPLRADPAPFAHLKKLDLRRNGLLASMGPRLRRRIPGARVE